MRWFFRAKTRYNVHSPFVYRFTEKVVEEKRAFYAFKDIEILRKLLLKNRNVLKIKDYGAGSLVSGEKERSVRSLVKYSATMPLYCRFLFHLINEYKPKTMLEMGTSVGISTLYQSRAAMKAKFITIEGDPGIAEVARQNLTRMKATNVQQMVGTFEEKLEPALKELKTLDYAFIDGNHREKPTIEYFEKCLEYANENSIFVFDDIHWTQGMEDAWNTIIAHPKVTLSIDMYFFGLVFFRKDFKKKENIALARRAWKPWIMGFLK
jgi:predicted O-methyltransferase YrrM